MKKWVLVISAILSIVLFSSCGSYSQKTTVNETKETTIDTVLEQTEPAASSKPEQHNNSGSNDSSTLFDDHKTLGKDQPDKITHGDLRYANRYTNLSDTQLNEPYCRRITTLLEDGFCSDTKLFQYTNILDQNLIDYSRSGLYSYSYEGIYSNNEIIEGTITHLNPISSGESIYSGTKTTFVLLEDGKIVESRLLGVLDYGDALESVYIVRNNLGLIEKYSSIDKNNDNRVTEYESSFSENDSIIIEHRKSPKSTFLFIYLLDENNRVIAGCSNGAFWVNYYDDDGYDTIKNCTSEEDVLNVLIPIWDRDKEEYEAMFEKVKKIFDTYE